MDDGRHRGRTERMTLLRLVSEPQAEADKSQGT
jgi:hypothetical protein